MEKVKLTEKIVYALGDAAAGGITWKIMSIAFPLFFTNVFGLTVADTAMLMLKNAECLKRPALDN